MFAKHQRAISEYARKGPDELADVLLFVYLTVQQQLHSVPSAMKHVKINGLRSHFLWGWKRDAYQHVLDNRVEIHATVNTIYDAYADPLVQERELLAYLATLPGLGLVKAGFVIQLVFGLGGCIDSNNIHRFELKREMWLRADAYKRAKPATKNKYLSQYQQMLQQAGGAEQLWDDWCIFVASRNKASYVDAHHVSALHCEALGIRNVA